MCAAGNEPRRRGFSARPQFFHCVHSYLPLSYSPPYQPLTFSLPFFCVVFPLFTRAQRCSRILARAGPQQSEQITRDCYCFYARQPERRILRARVKQLNITAIVNSLLSFVRIVTRFPPDIDVHAPVRYARTSDRVRIGESIDESMPLPAALGNGNTTVSVLFFGNLLRMLNAWAFCFIVNNFKVVGGAFEFQQLALGHSAAIFRRVPFMNFV